MQRLSLCLTTAILALALVTPARAQDKPRKGALGPEIKNPDNKFIVWGDYRVEVNQYGGLGRDWPWQFRDEQWALLKKKAQEQAKKEPPNIIRAILLVVPTIDATAVKRENGKTTVVGTRTSRMTPTEIKSAMDQWHTVEDLVFVFSGGNAMVLTDIKVIPEPMKVETDENWGFFSGPKYDLLDKYLPFKRGDYDSYNSVYTNRGLSAGPWGGTLGAIVGVKGCPTSDNIWIARPELDDEHAWVFWHEYLNQCCSSSSNILPYLPGEQLWNMYCWEWTGHRPDPVPHWPGWTNHRDMMRCVIRPTMWKHWRITAPYRSHPVGQWMLYGPLPKAEKEILLPPVEPGTPDRDCYEADPEMVRKLCVAPEKEGKHLEADLAPYDNLNVGEMLVGPDFVPRTGTHYLRTYVKSPKDQDVQILAGGDEDFEIWLNGNKIRDGYGWKYSQDDRKLFEKVTYTKLKAGINTLVYVIPNTDRVIDTRLRFGKPDGSGEQPEGVECVAKLGEGEQPLPLEALKVPDYKNPKLYKWADVGNDPWLSMPRMDEKALAELAGIPELKIRVGDEVRQHKNEKGEPDFKYVACQHLFLDVPKTGVTSPWIAAPAEDNAALNNDFDSNWKAAAWLRVPKRAGQEKDILLLRNDVAEPMMHLLKTKGRPGQESLVGWLVIERKLVYVLLVDLDIDTAKPPATELGLLTKAPEVIAK
jgi:hypothetical protein